MTLIQIIFKVPLHGMRFVDPASSFNMKVTNQVDWEDCKLSPKIYGIETCQIKSFLIISVCLKKANFQCHVAQKVF